MGTGCSWNNHLTVVVQCSVSILASTLCTLGSSWSKHLPVIVQCKLCHFVSPPNRLVNCPKGSHSLFHFLHKCNCWWILSSTAHECTYILVLNAAVTNIKCVHWFCNPIYCRGYHNHYSEKVTKSEEFLLNLECSIRSRMSLQQILDSHMQNCSKYNTEMSTPCVAWAGI